MEGEVAMKKLITFLTICLCLIAAGSAHGYDTELAQRLEQFYQPFDGKQAGKHLQNILAPDFVKAIKAGEQLFVLDVRTKGETGIYGITFPESMAVEMSQVFKPETLDKIPTDRKVVVVCKSGYRATAIAMGLREIGFDNTYVLKKGFVELAKYLTVKNAY